MSGMRCQSVQGLCEHIIEDYYLWEIAVVDAAENRKCIVVCTVAPIRGSEEDGRIDEGTWHLLDVDAPRVVVRRDICLSVAVVPFEATERVASLLDDSDPKCTVVLDVPAVDTYDPDINQYIVLENETTHTYDSKEAFESEWVPIKKPFIPERELPVPEYTRDAYAIIILHEDGDPVVYREGERAPVDTLVDDGPPYLATPEADDQLNQARVPTETLPDEPDASADKATTETTTDDVNSESELDSEFAATAEATEESEPASTIADLNKKEALGVFADQHLTETDEDVAVAKAEVYSAYESWAEDLGVEIVSNSWFTRRLKNYIEVETDRRRIDGELTRVFVSFTLDTEDESA